MKHIALMIAGILIFGSAAAQPPPRPAPLFTCEIQTAVKLLEPEQPAGRTLETWLYTGFVIDFATGILRWIGREGGGQSAPIKWTVTQRGGRSNDWVAGLNLDDGLNGDQQVLRIRTWGAHGTRFVLFTGLGAALVGICRG
jgi:hypothetical protein